MKRTFQPSKEKEETNTDLESVWLLYLDVRYWPVAARKEEKRFQFRQNRVTKNND